MSDEVQHFPGTIRKETREGVEVASTYVEEGEKFLARGASAVKRAGEDVLERLDNLEHHEVEPEDGEAVAPTGTANPEGTEGSSEPGPNEEPPQQGPVEPGPSDEPADSQPGQVPESGSPEAEQVDPSV